MLFSVALCGAVIAGLVLGPGRPSRRRPVLTTAAVLVIGTVSTLQLAWFPALRAHLGRDASAVRAGQVWRLVTALVTQDGGWVGFGFNLVTLALVGFLAERVLGTWGWVAAFAVPALVAEVVGLWWQPVGAGNSVAVAGLAGAIAVAAPRRAPAAVPAAASALAFVALAATRDIHGAAGVAGLVVGLVLRLRAGAASAAEPGGGGASSRADRVATSLEGSEG